MGPARLPREERFSDRSRSAAVALFEERFYARHRGFWSEHAFADFLVAPVQG
jgi:hypothetical protein